MGVKVHSSVAIFLLMKAMRHNSTSIHRNTKSNVQKSGNIRKREVKNTPDNREHLLGVFMQKSIYGIRDFSSENCCYGYQIKRNKQFMPILFNFIVFSNTQNFLLFSELGVVWSYLKLIENNYGVTALI